MSHKKKLESTDSQSIEMLTGSSSHLIDDITPTDVCLGRLGSRQESTEQLSASTERARDDDTIIQLASYWWSMITKRLAKWNRPGLVRDYSAIPDAGLSIVLPNSSRLSAIQHFSWVHLPSIAITLTLLSLYIEEIHWENPSVEVLNALQFAAKAHEVLGLMSLGDILLSRIFRCLHHQDTGIPLGFIPAAFYLGSPFRYLISGELWSPILYSMKNRGRHGTTGAMIILITILCVAASPLSAIAMIPRQIWWSNDYFNSDLNYVDGSVLKVEVDYNTHLNSKSGPYLNDTVGLAWDARTLGELWTERLSQNPTTITEFQNTTFSNYRSEGRPISIIDTHDMTHMSIATCPVSALARNLEMVSLGEVSTFNIPWIIKSERAAEGSTQAKRWKQPIVGVDCMEGWLNESAATFNYWDSGLKKFSLSTKQYPALAYSNESAHGGPFYSDHRYLGLRDAMDLPISTDILFTTTSRDGGSEETATTLFLCYVYARWVEAEIWIEPSQSTSVKSHLPFSKDEAPSEIIGAFNSSDFIRIDQGWMEGISVTPNASFYDQGIIRYCLDEVGCYSSALALHIVDAIAQLGDSSGRDASIDTQKDRMLQTAYFYTHTYVFQSSRGIPLAFSLLLLHVLLVLIHLTTILVSNHPWQGSTWESFGDMLVLALRSRAPDELYNIDERASNPSTWTMTAIVRRDGDSGQSQIILRGNNKVKEPSEGGAEGPAV